jgi:phage terminase large subunit
MSTARIELPPKLVEVFAPARGELRYRGAYGGRGSGKSFSFALMASIWGYAEPLRILCVRELQNSIKESFHSEIKNAIASIPWLAAHYDVGVDYIRGRNGTEFIFKGLRHNSTAVKSLAQIDLCIVEEAEDVPEVSWRDLEPTIRAPKSEIWVIWNPSSQNSPTDKRFRVNTPPRSRIVKMDYHDNPWFPSVLDEQRKHAQSVMDDATYSHIWEGAYLQNSKAQVFAGKYRVEEFTPRHGWDGPYFGLDFGFSQDPTAAVKCWVDGQNLYIEKEAGGVGIEIDETAQFMLTRIPGMDTHTVRADSARPESISYLRRNGLNRIEAVDKGKGSVEDGISHIKGYKSVIIHPECRETVQEFRLYSYKVDRLSGDVLNDVMDANNHYIDALRYALRPLMGGSIRRMWEKQI